MQKRFFIFADMSGNPKCAFTDIVEALLYAKRVGEYGDGEATSSSHWDKVWTLQGDKRLFEGVVVEFIRWANRTHNDEMRKALS